LEALAGAQLMAALAVEATADAEATAPAAGATAGTQLTAALAVEATAGAEATAPGAREARVLEPGAGPGFAKNRSTLHSATGATPPTRCAD
jgi:hypothetical protein